MLPLPLPVLNGVEVTHEEHRACLAERVRFLRDFAQAQEVLFPYSRAHWEAADPRWWVAGRDRDGSLLCCFTALGITNGVKRRYIRRVRLVKGRHLRLVSELG